MRKCAELLFFPIYQKDIYCYTDWVGSIEDKSSQLCSDSCSKQVYSNHTLVISFCQICLCIQLLLSCQSTLLYKLLLNLLPKLSNQTILLSALVHWYVPSFQTWRIGLLLNLNPLLHPNHKMMHQLWYTYQDWEQ